MKDTNCIFCKIAAGDIPSKTIYEDEQFRVIMDISPATKGHALILPKEHYANLYEIDEEVAAGAMKLAKKLATHMTDENATRMLLEMMSFVLNILLLYRDSMSMMANAAPNSVSHGKVFPGSI